MRSNGIKEYFASRQAEKADPEEVKAYDKSMDELIPTISRKIRESEELASELRLSRTIAARAKRKS